MSNSYFCRKPCNHVGLLKRRGCLICECIFLPIVLSSCSLLPFFRLHSSTSQQSSPLFFFSLNAKMYPRAVCGSWSITVHRSAYSVSHKSSISCSTLPAFWPLFLHESSILGRQGQANSPLLPLPLYLFDWHLVQVPYTILVVCNPIDCQLF